MVLMLPGQQKQPGTPAHVAGPSQPPGNGATESQLANFKFTTIGHEPALLKRMTAAQILEQNLEYPSTPSPTIPHSRLPSEPLNRPSLLERLRVNAQNEDNFTTSPVADAQPSTSAAAAEPVDATTEPAQSVSLSHKPVPSIQPTESSPNYFTATLTPLDAHSSGSLSHAFSMMESSANSAVAQDIYPRHTPPSVSSPVTSPSPTSPAGLISLISRVASEQAEWNEMKALIDRYRDEYREYTTLHDESTRALQREKEQASKVFAIAEAAFTKLEPLRVKQEQRWEAEQQKAQLALAEAQKLVEKKKRDEAAEAQRRAEAEAAEQERNAAEAERRRALQDAEKRAAEESRRNAEELEQARVKQQQLEVEVEARIQEERRKLEEQAADEARRQAAYEALRAVCAEQKQKQIEANAADARAQQERKKNEIQARLEKEKQQVQSRMPSSLSDATPPATAQNRPLSGCVPISTISVPPVPPSSLDAAATKAGASTGSGAQTAKQPSPTSGLKKTAQPPSPPVLPNAAHSKLIASKQAAQTPKHAPQAVKPEVTTPVLPKARQTTQIERLIVKQEQIPIQLRTQLPRADPPVSQNPKSIGLARSDPPQSQQHASSGSTAQFRPPVPAVPSAATAPPSQNARATQSKKSTTALPSSTPLSQRINLGSDNARVSSVSEPVVDADPWVTDPRHAQDVTHDSQSSHSDNHRDDYVDPRITYNHYSPPQNEMWRTSDHYSPDPDHIAYQEEPPRPSRKRTRENDNNRNRIGQPPSHRARYSPPGDHAVSERRGFGTSHREQEEVYLMPSSRYLPEPSQAPDHYYAPTAGHSNNYDTYADPSHYDNTYNAQYAPPPEVGRRRIPSGSAASTGRHRNPPREPAESSSRQVQAQAQWDDDASRPPLQSRISNASRGNPGARGAHHLSRGKAPPPRARAPRGRGGLPGKGAPRTQLLLEDRIDSGMGLGSRISS